MKIVIFDRGKRKFSLTIKLTITIVLSCTISLSVYQLNQPALQWQEAGQWQVKVYQEADQMMSTTPPWLLVNELEMRLTRQENGPAPWCLQIRDIKGDQLFPGITGLLIYYSKDLKVVSGFALNENSGKAMDIHQFFDLSLYGSEFFCPQMKKYQSLGLLFRDQVKIELSEKRGRSAWWDKEHSWWITYESNDPPLKAQLISQ
ncbi:hypothetical protein [Candidatus Formimonas warabiya]|uniref:Uncharacterized protein n=1 Tax=Formimonas warabiya TaxID=1761012 RepID=A0A3G1KMY4_FORW1|nr:hypothetical protein [Candidatus Formimonas warabiya]ATW23828.1 hypothetical protein DCMF_02565 [Candidatus Formimonas warabiya]